MSEINVEEIIELYNGYIIKISPGCVYIATELQKNNKNILNEIKNFSEGIEWLILASKRLKEHSIITNLNEENLIVFLKEINEALEIDDMVLVADLFEYEIAEYFKNPVLIEG